MGRNKEDNTKRAIIGARMNELFQKWKERRTSEGKSASMKAFGQLLNPPASRGSIENYLKGNQTPEPDRLKQIYGVFKEFFDIPEDYFDPETATHDELYKHSSAFQGEIAQNHVAFAKRMDLDLELVQRLTKRVDFNNHFPVYAPLPDRPASDEYFADPAPIEDKKLNFLQVNKNGKTITLSRYDLAFLKEVQDQVANFVEYLFYKRRKEMNLEKDQFDKDLIEVKVNGNPVKDPEEFLQSDFLHMKTQSYYTPSDLESALQEAREKAKQNGVDIAIGYKPITKEIIYKNDRFAKIVEDDAKEYGGFRNQEKPRKATQEDIDRLFGKGIVQEISQEDWDKIINKEGK